MGTGSWDSGRWDTYSATTTTRSSTENFTARGLKAEMNPLNVVREARDSTEHPNSTPIIVALDVTGSMGHIPQYMVTKGLGVLFNEILTRLPVKDPQVMVMAFGDAYMDRAPLQVGQFESDMTITKDIERIYIEGGGGGNGFESYDLPYYFALHNCVIDSFVKRGQPGFIFTIGDEPPPPCTMPNHVSRIIGGTLQSQISFADLIQEVRQSWIPYHITCMDSSSAPGYIRSQRLKERWAEVMGQSALYLDDHTKLSELVVSVLEMHAGKDVDTVAGSWSGSTAVTIRESIKGLALTGSGGKRNELVSFE